MNLPQGGFRELRAFIIRTGMFFKGFLQGIYWGSRIRPPKDNHIGPFIHVIGSWRVRQYSCAGAVKRLLNSKP